MLDYTCTVIESSKRYKDQQILFSNYWYTVGIPVCTDVFYFEAMHSEDSKIKAKHV